EEQPELAQWAGRAQESLRLVSTLDVVPPQWLHLTFADVGFVDEMPPNQVDEVVNAARAALTGWTGLSITLGPVTTMDDAVVLGATDTPELRQLRDRIQAATASVMGPGALAEFVEFWPHVTLAYVNGDCDRRDVLEPLGSMATDQFTVAVSRVTLAAVTRRDRHYQWTTRDVVPELRSSTDG
ncbi:MAG TPA: 2'-5' RNA ligase family protein, partial [Pseudonocardiaceae bacterium]|nr:2'-5' RNA ligase family protein [Pseudonocardiaceae bacterium]